MRLVVDDDLAAINCAVAPEVTNAQPDAGNDQRLWSVVLDFGPGSMGQLLNYLDPADSDAICIRTATPTTWWIWWVCMFIAAGALRAR